MALANADHAIFNGRPATLADMRQLGVADGNVVAQAAARACRGHAAADRENGCTRRQIKAYRRAAMATIQAERVRD